MQPQWKRRDLLSCSWKQQKVGKYKADILQVVTTSQSSSPPFCSLYTCTRTRMYNWAARGVSLSKVIFFVKSRKRSPCVKSMIATDTFYSSEPHSSESWNLNRRNHITLTVSTAVIIAVDTSNTLFSTRMPLWSWPQKEVQASSQELFCLALVLQWCKAAENPGPYFTVVLCTDLVPTAAASCKWSSVWKERELVILCNLCVKPCTFCLFGGLRGLGGSWTCVISVKFCKFWGGWEDIDSYSVYERVC